MLIHRTSKFWTSGHVYGCPKTRNIYCAVQIRITLSSTMTTPERFARTIRLTLYRMNVQAVVAHLACVGRIYQDQLYPKLNALVAQEKELLIEAPRVASTPLSLGSRQFVSTFTNSSQVFQCDDRIVSFGFVYQPKADGVVYVRLKSSLPTRQPLRVRRLPTEGNPDSSTGLTVSEVADIYADYFSCLSRLFVGVSFSSLHNDL